MNFRGCGTALLTPFKKDQSVDEPRLRDLVEWQVTSGIGFLVPCGTTGETPTLTKDEWLLNAVASRVEEGPEGLGGGSPGAAGKFHINGMPVRDLKKLTLQPDDVVLFETPGGGGYGHR